MPGNTPAVALTDSPKLENSSIESPPSQSIHSPVVIGHDGTLALLGYDHNLLQITSYDVMSNEPALIARAWVPPPPEQSPDNLSGQFLLLSQSREKPGNGWGLRVEPPNSCHVHKVQRGFIDSKQPTSLKYFKRKDGAALNHGDDGSTWTFIEKSTSYMKHALCMGTGSLVQATVVMCNDPSLAMKWRLGGMIQLVPGQFSRNEPAHDTAHQQRSFTYKMALSHDRRVLTVRCQTTAKPDLTSKAVTTDICLDITLFINGQAEPLEISADEDEEITDPFVDISQNGLVFPGTQASFSFVAVISVRNPVRKSNPTLPDCPTPAEIRCKLVIGPFESPVAKTLAEILREQANQSSLELREIPNIIAFALHRILGSLVTDLGSDGISRKLPIRNALHGYPLDKDADSEECLWLLRFLTFVADNFKTPLQDQITQAICGLMIALYRCPPFSPMQIDTFAYIALGFFLSRKYLCPTHVKEMAVGLATGMLNADEKDTMDPTTRLLQWAHTKVLLQLSAERNVHKEVEAGSRDEVEPDKGYPGADPGTTPEAEAERSLHLDRLAQQYFGLALERSSFRLGLGNDVDFSKENSEQIEDHGQAISREGKWAEIALLAVDLFSNDLASSERLLNEVHKKLAVREADSVGKIPPWGLRFRDHGVQIEFATMRAKLQVGLQTENAHDILQDTINKLSYFCRSDFSILSCVLEITEPSWASCLWSLNSFDACCSLLSIMVQSIPISTLQSRRQSKESSRATDLAKSLGDRARFPWQKSLVHARQCYPSFIRRSLQGRQLQNDTLAFNRFYTTVKIEDGDNKLVKIISPEEQTFFASVNDAQSWRPQDLTFGQGRMHVLDFSFQHMHHYQSDEDLRRILSEDRVKRMAAQRLVVVDYLPRDMMITYLFFGHPEAWDMLIDYFGWKLSFRASTEGIESFESTAENNWHTSITIPHFLHIETCIPDGLVDLIGQSFPVHSTPPKTAGIIFEVCTSACISGDSLGAFWTASLLGTGMLATQPLNQSINAPQHLQLGRTIKNVLGRFRYNKYGARSLVFVIHLTSVCHVVAERLEKVMKKVKVVLDLESSLRLYQDIVNPSFATSKRRTRTTSRLTEALERTLWGLNWLQKLDKCVTAALPLIDEATQHIEMRLSERRTFWDDSLRETEQRVVESHDRVRRRLVVFQSRVRDLNTTTANVKDTLISLTDMSMTRATLNATIDTREMKVLAYLTAVFLPFTFVAVFLTTPMFKWPDPPEGQYYFKTPLVLYFTISSGLAVLTALFMKYYSDEGMVAIGRGLRRCFYYCCSCLGLRNNPIVRPAPKRQPRLTTPLPAHRDRSLALGHQTDGHRAGAQPAGVQQLRDPAQEKAPEAQLPPGHEAETPQGDSEVGEGSQSQQGHRYRPGSRSESDPPDTDMETRPLECPRAGREGQAMSSRSLEQSAHPAQSSAYGAQKQSKRPTGFSQMWDMSARQRPNLTSKEFEV